MRTLPAVSGKKPEGWISPICEMNKKTVAVVDAFGRAVQPIRILKAGPLKSDRLARASARLRSMATRRYMGAAVDFDVEGRILREVIQPVEDLFVLFGGNHLLDHGAPGGYQEEDRPLHRPNFLDEGHHLLQDIDIVFGNGGVDLHAQFGFMSVVKNVYGPLPGAGNLAEIVVDFRTRSVQRKRDAADAGLASLIEPGGSRQGGGGRGE